LKDGEVTLLSLGNGSNVGPASDGSVNLDKWEFSLNSSQFTKGTWKVGVIADTSLRKDVNPSNPVYATNKITID